MEKNFNSSFKTDRIWLILFLVLASGAMSVFFWTGQIAADDNKNNTIYVIPVTGTVEPGMTAFIKRSLEEIIFGEFCL